MGNGRILGTTLVALTILASGAAVGSRPSHPGDPTLVPDEVVVLFRSALPPDLAAAAAGLGTITETDSFLAYATVRTEPARIGDVIARFAARPDVEAAYQARYATVLDVYAPNDQYYPLQWGPAAIGMPQAWASGLGSHEVTVAVIDTGIDYTHEDLASNTMAGDLDCGPDANFAGLNGALVAKVGVALDDHGHGTHVAGTVAALTGNLLGVAGMSQACVMGVKVLSSSGSGTYQQVASGISHAARNGADILSMSLGGGFADPTMARAVADAWAAGALIVAAAGNNYCPNESQSTVGYPGGFPEVIAVAALQAPGTATAAFSSCGPEVDIAAPGAAVISTTSALAGDLGNAGSLPDCVQDLIDTGRCQIPRPLDGAGSDTGTPHYGYKSGTSMATPHVSGVAALAKSHNLGLTNVQLRCILERTADDLGAPGLDVHTGWGGVDAAAAVAAAVDPASVGC